MICNTKPSHIDNWELRQKSGKEKIIFQLKNIHNQMERKINSCDIITHNPYMLLVEEGVDNDEGEEQTVQNSTQTSSITEIEFDNQIQKVFF